MKDLKNRAERILLYMLNMDPSENEPHMGLECSLIYEDGKEDPATAVQIYGPIECDSQPLLFTAHRWPGDDTIWTADVITDTPHVIDELLVHTSDLEKENEQLRDLLGRLLPILTDYEWPELNERDERRCMGCGNLEKQGHHSGCAIGQLLESN